MVFCPRVLLHGRAAADGNAAVLWTSCVFNTSYGSSSGGDKIKSHTSMANSGESDATM